MGEINQELAALRQEIAQLREQVAEADEWANGIQVALIQVLPFLLRGHPQADKVRDLLSRSEHGAGKMLFEQLVLLGAWPTDSLSRGHEQQQG